MREETHQLSNTVTVKETTLSVCYRWVFGRVGSKHKANGLDVCVCACPCV